jgi:prepilin-type N-terminal cleavage/methylation domain-containing protein
MRFSFRKNGFTLVEIVVVITIVALLVSMVAGLGKHVKDQANVKLTKSTIEILVTAVELYYQDNNDTMPFETVMAVDVDFVKSDFESLLGGAIDTTITTNDHSDALYDDDWSSEAMYYYLSKSLNSRRIINTINNTLATSMDSANVPLEVNVAGNNIVMFRVTDAWGNALRYRYTADDTFCVITSAGIDKLYGTADDITNLLN